MSGGRVQEIMDKEQAMLLEEVAAFQSRLEQRPMSTADAMQLSTKQIIEDIFPVRLAPLPLPLHPSVPALFLCVRLWRFQACGLCQ